METPVRITSDPLTTDWITACATAAAALFALIAVVGTIRALRSSNRLLQIEADRDPKQKEYERRDQARLIHGWATRTMHVIDNPSDGPIYNVHLPREGKPSSNTRG